MADEKTTRAPTPPTPAAMQVTPEQQAEQSRAARERHDAARRTATEGVDLRADETRKMNEAKMAQDLAGKPTPTQREGDLAKVGALDIDNKEDDGSGPEMHPRVVSEPAGGTKNRAMGGDDPARYKTRDLGK